MIQEKMVRARRQYHHQHHSYHHHQNHNSLGGGTGGGPRGGAGAAGSGGGGGGGNRHVLNNHHHQFHRSNKRPAHVPSAPSNTTQFIMKDHELIEPDFDLMHNAIMEHYNRRKRRKNESISNNEQQISDEGSEKSTDLSQAKFTGSPKSCVEDHDGDGDGAEVEVDCDDESKGAGVKQIRINRTSQSIENDSPELHSSTINSSSTPASPMKTASTTTATSTINKSPNKSPLKDVDDEESKNHHPHHENIFNNDNHNRQKQPQKNSQPQQQQKLQQQQNQMQQAKQQQTTTNTITMQLQESTATNLSQPTTPNYYYRPTGSPGDEDGLSPFINHEHLQSEFQEIYANIHTERLSSMSKHQLVDKYLLLEERVEELENQLRESQTASAAAGHG